jgi:hypothetical protein
MTEERAAPEGARRVRAAPPVAPEDRARPLAARNRQAALVARDRRAPERELELRGLDRGWIRLAPENVEVTAHGLGVAREVREERVDLIVKPAELGARGMIAKEGRPLHHLY